MFTQNYSDPIMADWSSELQWRRKVLHSHIKQYGSGMDEIERITDEVATEMIDELCDLEGQVVDIKHKIYSMANDILCVLLHGEKLEDKEERDIVYKVGGQDILLTLGLLCGGTLYLKKGPVWQKLHLV